MAEQQGASSEYLARLHSILHSLQVLQASVTSLLDFLGEVSFKIQWHIDQGTSSLWGSDPGRTWWTYCIFCTL